MKHIKLIIWIINTLLICVLITGVVGLALKKEWNWEEWLLITSLISLVLFNIVNVLTWIFSYFKKSKETIKECAKKVEAQPVVEIKEPKYGENC